MYKLFVMSGLFVVGGVQAGAAVSVPDRLVRKEQNMFEDDALHTHRVYSISRKETRSYIAYLGLPKVVMYGGRSPINHDVDHSARKYN